MATPFAAGNAALYLQVREKTIAVARSLRDVSQTTAQAIPSSKTDREPLQISVQAGSGLVNIYNAIHYPQLSLPANHSE